MIMTVQISFLCAVLVIRYVLKLYSCLFVSTVKNSQEMSL